MGDIGIVLVDDQPLIRQGLKLILDSEPGFEIVGEADDGAEALVIVDSVPCDLVVMDIRMPVLDGVAATRSIAESGGPPVLVLTTFGENEILWDALDAGAAGFALKSASSDDLIGAVRSVASGGSWLDPTLMPEVLESYRRVVIPQKRDAGLLDDLTPREHDVLRLMARGRTNSEISSDLFVGETTVKTHVGAIFSKLGVRDRAAAIVYAFDHGVVTPGGG
ncbi:MAG: response regulator transcription factor [Acidimicrobiales bacterium]